MVDFTPDYWRAHGIVQLFPENPDMLPMDVVDDEVCDLTLDDSDSDCAVTGFKFSLPPFDTTASKVHASTDSTDVYAGT